MENLELAQRIVDEAKKAGADFADATAVTGRHVSVDVEKGSIRSTDVSRTEDLVARAFVKGASATFS